VFLLFAFSLQLKLRHFGDGYPQDAHLFDCTAQERLPHRLQSLCVLPFLLPKEVVEQICKLAKKGLPPSTIGRQLRDSNGSGSMRAVTGRKILRIVKHNGRAPEIPEDLYMLIKRAVTLRKHLEKHRKDMAMKFRLVLVESRVHRLARYYRRVKHLPANWKYEASTASALVA